MTRALYWTHRWAGVVLAMFMLVWFASGLVIMYSETLNQGREQQLAHAETLQPQAGWLSLGDAWDRSAAARKTLAEAEKAKTAEAKPAQATAQPANAKPGPSPNVIAEARLVREAGRPLWLVENGPGKRFAISAEDGTVHRITVEDALRVASQWVEGKAPVSYLDTIESDSTLNNLDSWKPFHRISVDDGAGSELLVSARTGEVIRASTAFERGLYYTGNWIHLLKFIDVFSPGETRHDVQLWTGFGATAACLTGLIVGWLRWRPGWFGRPTYSKGRTQPYRDFWWKWHFWGGLIGGMVALGWGLSGYLSTNPWKIFSNGNPSRAELSTYLGESLPVAMRDWKPAALKDEEAGKVVELSWRRLGDEAVLLAYTPEGHRFPRTVEGAVSRFSDTTLTEAAKRLVGGDASLSQAAMDEYDSYYYLRRGRGTWDRPLPATRIDFADDSGSRLYLDPLDGRLLIKQDQSRRVYRWAFNLLHYWDFGWFNVRPVWDVWMLTWVVLGLVFSGTSMVLGWKRLKITFRVKKRANAPGAANPTISGVPAVETAGG
ncbi:MAG: peptidase [Methylococcaceae bacterium]|nr:peptidase [Methylococcaceae bacterium]